MLPDNPWLHCWAYYNFHYRKFFKLKTRKIFSRQSIRYKHFRKTRNASEKWLFSFLFSSFLCLNFWSFNATFKKGAKKVKFRQQHHGVYKKKKDNQFKVNRWVFFLNKTTVFFLPSFCLQWVHRSSFHSFSLCFYHSVKMKSQEISFVSSLLIYCRRRKIVNQNK